jgi:hypothetical protein
MKEFLFYRYELNCIYSKKFLDSYYDKCESSNNNVRDLIKILSSYFWEQIIGRDRPSDNPFYAPGLIDKKALDNMKEKLPSDIYSGSPGKKIYIRKDEDKNAIKLIPTKEY